MTAVFIVRCRIEASIYQQFKELHKPELLKEKKLDYLQAERGDSKDRRRWTGSGVVRDCESLGLQWRIINPAPGAVIPPSIAQQAKGGADKHRDVGLKHGRQTDRADGETKMILKHQNKVSMILLQHVGT
jgi:hypothetical protein